MDTKSKATVKAEAHSKEAKASKPTCGIIMPISEIDGCIESHWTEVLMILCDALESAGFEAKLVSESKEVGIIQKRIVTNVYNSDMVVCDVSARNPNVMFELGLRLAFDKPTIIVKDDHTPYSFDTSLIEHLAYPRDLRFGKIVEFKKELRDKVKATHHLATTDPNYSTFLKHVGPITVATLQTKEISKEDFIIEELQGIKLYIEQFLRVPPQSGRIAGSMRLLQLVPESIRFALHQIAIGYFTQHPSSPLDARAVDYMIKQTGERPDILKCISPSDLRQVCVDALENCLMLDNI